MRHRTGRRWAITLLCIGVAGSAVLAACGQDLTTVPQGSDAAQVARIGTAGLSRSNDFVPGCNDCNPWIPLSPPQSAEPTIGVAISGPTSHQFNQTCQFQAVVNSSGATPPYSYQWTGAGDSGSGEFFYPNSTGITYSYQVTLTVTDANGHQGVVARTVYVGSSYPPCPE
jgi:hypothetical protein